MKRSATLKAIRPDNKGRIDDVAISGKSGSMFRLERLNSGCFWVCFYEGGKKNKRVAFELIACKGTITAYLREDEIGCVDDRVKSK